MSDMNASVVLKMIDGLSRPARAASASVRGLVKDLEKLRSLSGNATGKASRQFENLTKEMKKSQKAAASLHQTMSRPMTNGFRNATTGINSVTTAANRAANAVTNLNRRMRGGGGNGGPGGHGGFNSGRSAGAFGHVGRSVGSAFMHVGVYEAVDHGIHAMSETIREGVAQAFDLQHTKAMLAIQGENSGTISDVIAKARQMSKDIPQFTTAQNAAAIAELRPAMVGGIREAMHLAPQFQKAVGVLEAVKMQTGHAGLSGVDSHGEALDLARAMELKGVMGDGDKAINSYMNAMVKAIVAFNGQITAGDFHAAIKYGRGAARGWSEDFVEHYLPTIMNDIKSKNGSASGAGNALASFSRTVVDRVMKGTAMDAWNDLGLIKKGSAHFKGKHVASIDQDGIVGVEKAIENPYEWFQTYFMPAMKKKNGGKDPKDAQIISELGSLFGNRIAQMLATIMAVQKKQIEKDAQNVRDAMGIDGLKKLYRMDSTTRMQVLSASLKELEGAIGSVATSGTMRGMKGLIDWAHHTADAVNGSSYVKTLGGHYDAFVAGLFGQGVGRKGFANGPDKAYYAVASELAGSFRRLTSAMGENFRFIEEKGAFRVAIAGLSGVFDGLAASANVARGAAQALSDALNSTAARQVSSTLAGAIDSVLAAAGLDKKTREDIHGPGRRNQGLIKSTYPAGPEAPTPVQTGRNGSKVPSLWNPIKAFFSGPAPLNSAGSVFGLGGFANMGSQITQPITSAMSSVTPMIAKTGGDAMAALASGITAGAGSVEAAMGQVLANLSTIAGAGVTVPVKLDTAAAEAQLSSMMSRASRLGSLSRAPQFSPALSDIGN